ncbi:MAG: IPT/TIG domain-containing protein [Elusimicrobia bacterium]|nr:IPT/TIG domain-containing protein [Candidatus Liberimonas magnetica]
MKTSALARGVLMSLFLAGLLCGLKTGANAAGSLIQITKAGYNGGDYDDAYGVKVDASGNIFVAGSVTNSAANSDYFIIKYNSNLQVISSATFNTGGDDFVIGEAIDTAGNVFVTGYTFNGLDYDYLTVKYNNNLQFVSSTVYDSGLDDTAFGITTDPSNNVFVTGYVFDGLNYGFYTIKYSNSLSPLANIAYSPGADSYPTSIASDTAGNIFVTGYTFNGTNNDYVTLKYTNNLASLSASQPYDSGFDDIASGVAIDTAGNVFVTGSSSNGTLSDFFTVKYTNALAVVSSTTYSSGFNAWAQGVAVDTSGNVVVTGYGNTAGGGEELITLKYDNFLQTVALKAYSADLFDDGYAVTTDSLNNIYVTGSSYNNLNNDFLTIKYNGLLPTVYSISPVQGRQGQTIDVTVNGISFFSGAQFSLGSGITTNSVTFQNDTQVTANISISTFAAKGTRNAVLTNLDAGYDSNAAAFTVNWSTPLVTALSPSFGYQGENINVTISGRGIQSGAAASFSGTGITVTTTTVTNPYQAVASITMAADAPAGFGDVTITNLDGGSGTKASSFAVRWSTPTLTSISVNSGQQGDTLNVTLTGQNFHTGAAASFSGTGITVNNTAVTSLTQAVANITISTTSAAGLRDITLTNSDGAYVKNTGAFTVRWSSPVIAGIAPVSGNQGQNVNVALSGDSFHAGAAVNFSGTGITVNNTSITNLNEAVANITISTFAAIGQRDVTITNSDGFSKTAAGAFTVKWSTPVISSVYPALKEQGQTTDVTLTGQGFHTGAVASFSGTGITVNNTTVSSLYQAVANITLAADAAAGVRDITITNSDGGAGIKTGAFTVSWSTPVINSIAPSIGSQGQTLNVTLTGQGFHTGAAVSFSGTGITVNNTTVSSLNQIITNISVASNANLGLRNITITNSDNRTSTKTGALNVILPAPAISTVAPVLAKQGESLNITITGQNFRSGASLAFSGDGITVTTTTVTNATQAAASIAIAANASAGARDVTLTNLDGATITNAGAFEVKWSLPALSTVAPISGRQGDTLNVTLTGQGFHTGAVVAFSGTGITVNNTTVSSLTQAVANISIAANATLGLRDITVTNSDAGSVTKVDAFKVNLPLPVITSVVPDSGKKGENVNITLTGQNFQSGAAVSFSGTGVTVTTTTVTSLTQAVVSISIAANASIGLRDITLTNSDTGSTTKTGAFNVLANEPVISSISPVSEKQGESLNIALTGQNFRAGAAVSFSGTGITVTTTTVTSPTQATASIVISANASLGSRNITLTNSDTSVFTKTSAFTVLGANPVISSITPVSGKQGESLFVTLTGQNFRPGAAVSFSGTGITVTTTTVSSLTLAVANIVISADASLGSRNITVTNSDGVSGTKTNAFTVNWPAPALSSIAGALGRHGQSLNVTLTGQGIRSGASVSFSGTGITVTTTTVSGLTQAVASISISANAALGLRDVTITNSDGLTATKTETFRVCWPLPVIANMTPGSLSLSQKARLVIEGENIHSGTGIYFNKPGIKVSSTSVASINTFMADVEISSSAPLGSCQVFLTSADGALCLNGYEVNIIQPAFVSSAVNPDAASILEVTINGGDTVTTEIPQNAFPVPVTLKISSATVPSAGGAAIKTTVLGIEITNDAGLQPVKDITIIINYTDAAVAGFDQSKLVLAWYDAANSRFVPVPSVVYPALHQIVAKISHFSKFAVVQLVAAADVEGIKVYPNPFNPNTQNLTVDKLPLQADIKIYSILGELIRSLSYTSANGQAAWDGKNDSNSTVASGVYIMLVDSPQGKKKVKIAVEK